jgi:pimeloyl-ACP methyl ester carboxylesterase
MRLRFSDWFHRVLHIPYKLYVESVGDKERPTIILLHGIAASSHGWYRLLPLLLPKYRCVSIDLLGFGNSPKPTNASYSPDQHVASIRRTIRSLNLKEPYVVAGHSLGSLLAAKYIRHYPAEVTRFYMLSPPIYVGKTKAVRKYSHLRMGAYLRAYRYMRLHKRFTLGSAKHLKKILNNSLVTLNEETWVPFVRSLEQCIENQNVIDDLEQIHTPTTILYGSRDPLIIPREIAALESYSHITTKKLAVGHVMSEKYVAQVADVILSDR